MLELGCANGRIGQRFKESHPHTEWWGVNLSAEAAATAAPHLDRVFTLDLDTVDLSVLGRGFDVIVIGDLLEHLRRPQAVLEARFPRLQRPASTPSTATPAHAPSSSEPQPRGCGLAFRHDKWHGGR